MKKVSSIVWQYFDRLEENKRCVAVLCKLCDTEYKYFGNTTNLRAHLIKKHPIQWEFRQNNAEGTKVLDVSSVRNIYEDEESTNQSTISPRRSKMTKAVKEDKNVRYSLSIQNPDSGATGEETLPTIEIQRVFIIVLIGYVCDCFELLASISITWQFNRFDLRPYIDRSLIMISHNIM